MARMKIQVGQVWKEDATGETFLVTRIYGEALATFAVLRSTKDDSAKPVRVKVARSTDGPSLPGYSPTQSFEAG
ncbi:MAG TPA: hypothetical protein VLV89_08590 [Candidatus Acidoferrum sp.]|nr:hypothetical protein [Candidatus Acidoferrum sp.]